MKSIGIILEYLGPINALRSWSQELMAYNLLLVHMPDFMMRYDDVLNYGPCHKIMNTYSDMVYTLHK